nr:MAG TPA: hypothetical protein [Caudoviricetes sp.]
MIQFSTKKTEHLFIRCFYYVLKHDNKLIHVIIVGDNVKHQ